MQNCKIVSNFEVEGKEPSKMVVLQVGIGLNRYLWTLVCMYRDPKDAFKKGNKRKMKPALEAILDAVTSWSTDRASRMVWSI